MTTFFLVLSTTSHKSSRKEAPPKTKKKRHSLKKKKGKQDFNKRSCSYGNDRKRKGKQTFYKVIINSQPIFFLSSKHDTIEQKRLTKSKYNMRRWTNIIITAREHL